MKEQKGKIGIREYVAIILLTVGVKLSDDTPAIIIEHVDSALWIVPLLIGLLSFIPIYLLIKVITTYKNKNLHDVILHLFGRYLGVVISLGLLLMGTASLIVDSAVYVDILGTMYYTETPSIIIYCVLVAICAYGGKKGLEQIGSVAWLVLFYVKISLLMALILTLRNSNLSFMFPILGSGGWEIIKESTSHISIYGDFFYLGLIAPYLTSAKVFKKGTLLALLIITIELSLSFLIYIFLFDYPSLKMLNYPYHEIIRYISVGFLTNIETFFLPIWLLAAFVRFSFYLYLISLFLGGIFNIKNFEYLIPTIATIIVIIGMVPESPTFTIFFLRERLLYIISPLFIILPCLMWLLAKIKGDLKHEKDTKS
ncbi:GerAB/ArcD/ProY family transporter [Ferdinandcohnia quinoae]|uniref:Spore germination protein n=1 Tax=Fredinandcohnia quinoae TaxID=2918902 RepID=A0AAW5EBM6_9BACI|nr:GerAB/ArcD/ProY family transporter [Fredinandcohnia sp. SECRCQ15]MCH1627372.1 spore germination protein [Fredinandcohnia sp. SECRCQ15]